MGTSPRPSPSGEGESPNRRCIFKIRDSQPQRGAILQRRVQPFAKRSIYPHCFTGVPHHTLLWNRPDSKKKTALDSGRFYGYMKRGIILRSNSRVLARGNSRCQLRGCTWLHGSFFRRSQARLYFPPRSQQYPPVSVHPGGCTACSVPDRT